jgi:hypothetical protein
MPEIGTQMHICLHVNWPILTKNWNVLTNVCNPPPPLNMKFNENLFSGSKVAACVQMEGRRNF